MFRSLRIGTLGLLLAVGTSMALAPLGARAAQPQRQQNLQLHKWKFRVDDSGRIFLSVQFANMGGKAVQITGIAPARKGPWTLVGQKLPPEGSIRWSLPIEKDPPETIWVDCSDGLLHFDLPTRH